MILPEIFSINFQSMLPDDNGRNPFFSKIKNPYKSIYVPTNPYKNPYFPRFLYLCGKFTHLS